MTKILSNNFTEVHPSWMPFVKENSQIISHIESALTSPFNPPAQNVLRFMQNDLSSLSAVILGQDPYPDPKAATGRCFEVGYLTSWTEPFRQVSLKNIIRSLYHCYTGENPYTSFETIAQKIKDSEFKIAPPNRLFKSWETQGVLLLNASLTCQSWVSASHRSLWAPFTQKLLPYISSKNPNINWFLWGSDAASYTDYIENGILFKSRHPMMCHKDYKNDFLKNPCFKATRDKINWLG